MLLLLLLQQVGRQRYPVLLLLLQQVGRQRYTTRLLLLLLLLS
jgi:hypothetical protein